jgi:hypothetical protein
MNYLCHIPIEEFGQCLQITDDTKQLYTLTDGFSVASLKVKFYWIKLWLVWFGLWWVAVRQKINILYKAELKEFTD